MQEEFALLRKIPKISLGKDEPLLPWSKKAFMGGDYLWECLCLPAFTQPRIRKELLWNTWMVKAVWVWCPVLPTQGTGICSTGPGKGAFMAEILIKFIQECCFWDFWAAGSVHAKLKTAFVCPFPLTQLLVDVWYLYSAFLCLILFMACPETEPWASGKGQASRTEGFPAVERDQLLQRAWFWQEAPPAELLVWLSCCSQCHNFPAPPLCL